MKDKKGSLTNNIINPALDQLAKIKAKEEEIQREAASVVKSIRDGLIEAAVVFVDMVDSTQYKIDHESTPEKWILRVKQFSEIVAAYIESANGKVVKYIGDEVMGIFEGSAAINNALNLINRVTEIESSLQTVTREITRLKIVVDFGKVFLVEYEGHKASDPQGTPVDRCARIGKHAEKGTVLSSYEFVRHCEDRSKWTDIGAIDFKGIGPTKIFQLGAKTINIVNKILIEEEKLKSKDSKITQLSEENQRLQMAYDDAVRKNKHLEDEVKKLGARPAKEDLISNEDSDKEWESFSELVDAAADLVSPLPNIVIEALYHEFTSENFYPEGDDYNDAMKAKQKGFLLHRGGSGWAPDEGSAKIRKALKELKELTRFLDAPPSDDFVTSYEEANDDERPDLSLRPFWNRHLGLRG